MYLRESEEGFTSHDPRRFLIGAVPSDRSLCSWRVGTFGRHNKLRCYNRLELPHAC